MMRLGGPSQKAKRTTEQRSPSVRLLHGGGLEASESSLGGSTEAATPQMSSLTRTGTLSFRAGVEDPSKVPARLWLPLLVSEGHVWS